VAGINIKNYTGTITQGTGNTITVGGSNFNQQAAGSTFTGGSDTITVTGNFTLSNGAFQSTSATLSAALNFTLSGGTFTHNSGTVNLNASGLVAQTVTCSGSPFNLVTMNQTNNSTGVVIASGCTVAVGNNPILQTAYGSGGYGLTINGTLSGSGTLYLKGYNNGTTFYNTRVKLSCGTSTCLSGFTGLDNKTSNTTQVLGPEFSISGSGTSLDANSYATFNLSTNTLTLSSSGYFKAPAGTWNMEGSITINTGTSFDPNGGTINFNGVSQTVTCTQATAFNLITLSNSSTFTLGNGCTATLSDSHPTIPGSVTINGILSPGTNANLSFSGTSSTLTISATGTFTAPSGTLNTKGNITINSGGTFNNNSGTVNLNASGLVSQTITCTGSPFNLVTMNQTSSSASVIIASGCTVSVGNNPTLQVGYSSGGTGIIVNGILSGTGTLYLKGYNNATTFWNPYFTLSCGSSSCLSGFTGLDLETANNAHVLGPNFTITGSGTSLDASSYTTLNLSTDSLVLSSSASFTAPSGIMSVGRNITINSGTTFNTNGGTVQLNGSSAQTLSGAITFNNLTIVNAAGRTITFPASTTQTILNALTITGISSGSKILLRSSSPGTQWNINANGPNDIKYIDVQDSNACSGRTLIATNSTDSGRNSCWQFVTSGVKNPTYILRGVQLGPGVHVSGN
ncbi:MAG: beta strand repeat-containing protein, partial [Candidatus Levyibacteriota bacterium]